MHPFAPVRLQKFTSVLLVVLLTGLPAVAGIRVQGTQGLTMTGADGVYYDNTSGLTMTGADGFLAFDVNGINSGVTDGLTMTGADGLTMTGADGLTMTGADGGAVATVDGVTYTGSNSYTAAHVNGLTMTGADGLTMTGADGLTMTGADGTTWQVNSVVFREPQGLTMTGADGLTMTGADGLTTPTGTDGLTMTGADGLTMTGADTVRVNSANTVLATRMDGTVFPAPTQGLTMTGADGLTMTGADGVAMHGVQGLTMTGADGLAKLDGEDEAKQATGLLSFDPELALLLDRLTDDSNVNAAIVYHKYPYDPDFAELRKLGVRGGTRYRHLPVLTVTATKCQLEKISRLPNVRSIYGNRTLKWDADAGQTQTGVMRAREDSDLLSVGRGQPAEGANVGVAVLDTGIDSTHPDLAGRVIQNVKLVDLQGANLFGFNYATPVTGLPDTDQLSGHGTFVAGVIAGSGLSSGGKYRGYAPKARLLGLSAGDASLFNVLSGFDYILSNPALNIRVVNCSFSADTLYDPYDPVNIATRLLAEARVNVVFSAGNTGPGIRTLNPYAQAPWVISVGAVDGRGRLASFSSRGDFGSRNFRPTLVAPGVGVVSLRASGTNLTGTTALRGDLVSLSPAEIPYYTTASGTSFSAPQVAGAIALMIGANPRLTVEDIRDILQRTATPMPPYYQHEVGAGLLNAHAALLESVFPARQFGLFRAVLNRGQMRFVKENTQVFEGTARPGLPAQLSVKVPADAAYAAADLAWGPMLTTNDLMLAVLDSSGETVAESNFLNAPGLTGKRERALLYAPAAGAYKLKVAHTFPSATAQAFKGVFETARVEYAPLSDLSGLDARTAEGVRFAMRSLALWPEGGRFRPQAAVTRQELAAALVAAGRVPQYMPASPSFVDVRDTVTMNSVESAQTLFHDAVRGGSFLPDAATTRLVAAVVLVRAAGLRQEAESAQPVLTYTDAQSIPSELRGYVALAVREGLLSDGAAFNPNAALTRAELARAVAALVRMNVE
ncbi:MAG TPA: S8 family serine peptidase [Pyrinomonadaceae bacterium]|nr:S8 family serine peptidase [Pyrinomonadaceae bacterium]